MVVLLFLSGLAVDRVPDAIRAGRHFELVLEIRARLKNFVIAILVVEAVAITP
jgi:hypothetical protein